MTTGALQIFFLNYMNTLWGTHDVNRFVNHENAKLSRLNSAVYSPGCEAFDPFSQNWLEPPMYLISKTIIHILDAELLGFLLCLNGLPHHFSLLFLINKVKKRKELYFKHY